LRSCKHWTTEEGYVYKNHQCRYERKPRTWCRNNERSTELQPEV